jgi:inner membrane protein involved in colicin E2 resistance
MFGFVQWDSPAALLLEVLLSLVVVAGLIVAARRVNAKAEAERRERSGTPQQPGDRNGA